MNVFKKTNLKCTKARLKHTWIKPDGTATTINLYNCITKRKEPLIVKNPGLIKWYTCGPTVYDSSHVGHASCYVKLDILQNILKRYFNYDITTAMNITDIDDKIINKARAFGVKCRDLSERYEKEFWTDLKCLGVTEPNVILRVTENIDVIVSFIRELMSKGYAYRTQDGSVYFDVSKYARYGKLENVPVEQQGDGGKKSSSDFSLWKSKKDGEPFWNSPWGDGRPGWHIECSALASNILGSNFDIHAGGIDLRFPHHENEEAQSCCYHDNDQWVNYWIHTGHLHRTDSEKMSKSLGNTVTIQEMLKEASPETFRMACLMSSYRSRMDYSKELLDNADNNLKVYKNFFDSCNVFKSGTLKSTVNTDVLAVALNGSYETVRAALCDDFDTPKVLKTINELVALTNSMIYNTATSDGISGMGEVIGVQNFIKKLFHVFGFSIEERGGAESDDLKQVVDVVVNFRQNLRLKALESKNSDMLGACDELRDELKKQGIIVKDFGKVSSWSM